MIKKILLVFCALVALAGGVFTQRWLHQQAIQQDVANLQAIFPDLDGKPHRLDEWQNKILIINFWASWCPPCIEEMPEFVKLQNELSASGVQFVGIFINDEAQAVKDFLKTNPVNYPILDGTLGGSELADKLGNKSGVLPYSVVFNKGQKIHTETGRFTREEVLEVLRPVGR